MAGCYHLNIHLLGDFGTLHWTARGYLQHLRGRSFATGPSAALRSILLRSLRRIYAMAYGITHHRRQWYRPRKRASRGSPDQKTENRKQTPPVPNQQKSVISSRLHLWQDTATTKYITTDPVSTTLIGAINMT